MAIPTRKQILKDTIGKVIERQAQREEAAKIVIEGLGNTLSGFTDRDTLRRSMRSEYANILRISNRKQLGYKKIVVSRSMDDVCGSFEITVDRSYFKLSTANPGRIVNIKLDGSQIMRGRIYKVRSVGDDITGDIIISGRDVTGDLVDSSVPDSAKVFTSGVDILTVAKGVINSLGLGYLIGAFLKGQDSVEPFSEDEIISSPTASSAVKFLHKYCRKRQLLMNTDVFGNLLLLKAEGTSSKNRVINELQGKNNNVISYDATYDITERFQKYICKTQDASAWGGGEVDADSTVIDKDPFLYEGRELEFVMEEGGLSSDTKLRANEEVNLRRARSFVYKATVDGFKDNTLWSIDQVVKVVDDSIFAVGDFLVKSVEYVWDVREGKTTVLGITSRDAYTAQANIDETTSKQSQSGTEWTTEKPVSEVLQDVLDKVSGDSR